MLIYTFSFHNVLQSYRFPLKFGRLHDPILKLLHVLLPDGVKDPVIVARVVASSGLTWSLPAVTQDSAKFSFRM